MNNCTRCWRSKDLNSPGEFEMVVALAYIWTPDLDRVYQPPSDLLQLRWKSGSLCVARKKTAGEKLNRSAKSLLTYIKELLFSSFTDIHVTRNANGDKNWLSVYIKVRLSFTLIYEITILGLTSWNFIPYIVSLSQQPIKSIFCIFYL